MIERHTRNVGGGLIGVQLDNSFRMINNLKGIRLIADWGGMKELWEERQPVLFRYGVYWSYQSIGSKSPLISFGHDVKAEYPDNFKSFAKDFRPNATGQRLVKIYEKIDYEFNLQGNGKMDVLVDVGTPPGINGFTRNKSVLVGIPDHLFFEPDYNDFIRVGGKLLYPDTPPEEENLFEYEPPKYYVRFKRDGVSNGYQVIRFEQMKSRR